MKVLNFFILLSLFPFLAFGQITISGTVKSEKNNEPLAGAHVQLKGTYRGAVTGPKGKFTLSDVSKGKHVLKISYLGYHDRQKPLTVSNDRQISILLQPKALLQDEVLIQGTRANRGTPTTYTNVEREEIEAENSGKNMPSILSDQPSVVTSSDDGLGVGYSGMRIRGTSQSRINVTINGIPLNDAESQGVFWVDIPNIAASSENIQIQRGVGTSTNGAGAFGATVNLQTSTLRTEPYAEIKNSYGSFNTLKNNLQFGTGLIDGKWSFQGSLSRIQSDGYIDRATSDLKSYYLSGGYYGENTIIKGIMFGGREETYQAWLGVPESKMGNYAPGQNYLGDLAEPLAKLFGNDPTVNTGDRAFNPYTYEDQIDHYSQDHYQLHISQQVGDFLNFSGALHYTYGRGYYEQYREDASLALHKIDSVKIGNTSIGNSDLVRRRWLKNHFYGATFSTQYDNQKDLVLTLGGAWNIYDGAHFGKVIWSRFAGDSEIRHKFYDNNALKNDFNIYTKANYQLSPSVSVYGDLQYRKVSYKTMGLDLGGINITQSDKLRFFNPKAGIDYKINSKNSLYAFYGIGNREPTRNDYIDAPEGEKPSHETLHNVELGYFRKGKNGKLKLNAYYMDYKNQLVQTGELNDVGAAIRTNVDQSYRAGIEVIGAYRFNNKWSWNGNLTLSRNKILNMDYKVSGEVVEHFDQTTISFSPPVIGAGQWQYEPFKGFTVDLKSKYVGRQYLDNTASPEKMIEGYLLNDLRLTYEIKDWALFKSITTRFHINNILNVKYASSGYTYSYQNRNNEIVTRNYFYPQAGRHYMGTVSLKF